MAASGGALNRTELPPIDVLIVVALQDELDAVLVEGGGAHEWREVDNHIHIRTLPNDAGQMLGVAAAWTGAMGMTATATRAAPLVAQLLPSCLAMCGICAGKRGDVALGDVIVADRVFSFDHGKLVAAQNGNGPSSFFHDIETYNLERSWRMNAAAFRRDLDWGKGLLPLRPPTRPAQRRWLLRALHAHETGGPAPLSHPERAAMFRTAVPKVQDWADCIVALRKQELLESTGLRLTEAGRRAAEDDLMLYPDGAPADPEFQVHVGPIATGNAVIEDPKIFDRLKLVGRKTLGVEMEAFAIGHVGDTLPQRALIAKAVSDHADHDKDDRFRDFACRASARWLFAFLTKHLTPRPVDMHAPGFTSRDDPGPRSPFPDLPATRREGSRRGDIDEQKVLRDELEWDRDQSGVGELHRRVERALALQYPNMQATWKQGPIDPPAPLCSFLELREPRRRHTTLNVVAVVEGDVEAPLFESFLEQVVQRYGPDQQYVEPWLVYTGAVSSVIADHAGKEGVRLVSLLELQGLLDFRPYLEQQTSRLEGDPIYPPGLFVPQKLAYRVGLDSFEAEDALEALDSWLGQDGPQLMLVLGDFGTGKTFLMHEMALRLGRRHLQMRHAIVPILVELRKLEKSRSLEALLGQHFIPERGMRRFDHDAFKYMLQEGRLALLFDGFDELALRVTYTAAAEHLETVLQAAIGKAKVMITSRTQHFLNDQQVLQALGEHVQQRGFRMLRLKPFDPSRIQRFLENRFGDAAVARQRFALLDEVKDLLGLSHNPRMLGFISEIDEQDLRTAAHGGEITSATLYRVLLRKWLGHEVERDHPPGIEASASEAARWKAATELARLLWTRKERTIPIAEIPPEILDEVSRLSERLVSREAAAFKIGSATLLCRDEEGRFSFIHQSVIEWLVASIAADDLSAGRSPELLAGAEITDLMADFLRGLAGQSRTVTWALEVLVAPPSEIAAANANRVLQRLGRETTDELAHRGSHGRPAGQLPTARQPRGHVPIEDTSLVQAVADLSGHDLRGRDFSQARHLRGALLERANLSEASLVGADLSNAVLKDAHLRRANLTNASLAGADLRGADLSFARLLGADLTGANLVGTRLHYTALVGARIERNGLQQADVLRVAPAHPRQVEAIISPPSVPCTAVAFTPDSALLAAGYEDGTVVIWDGLACVAVRGLEGHAGGLVTSVAFSRDGSLLASACEDETVRLWNSDTGKLLYILEGHSHWVRCVAFSSDGRTLASASFDESIRLWNPGTGKLLCTLLGHSAGVTSVAFSPDDRIVASASHDKTVRLWSPETGACLRTFEGHSFGVRSVAFSPDACVLASAAADGTVRLWSPDTGELIRVLERHSVGIRAVTFSPDARILASAAADGTVRLWSPDTGRLLRTLEGHSHGVRSIAFSYDGRMLASASDDHTVMLWSPDTGKPLRVLEGNTRGVWSIAFSPNAQVLASASDDRTVRLWNPTSGKLVDAIKGSHGVWGIAFSPDAQVMALACDDKSVRLWDFERGKRRPALRGHAAEVTGVAFSPDGRILASASDDNTVRLWSLASGKPVGFLTGHSRGVTDVAFSREPRVLASASDDNTIRLWSPDTGEFLRVLEGHSQGVRSVAFSLDGGTLASASDDHTVRLWRPDTGMLLRALEGHSQGVRSVAFSPDARFLASGSDDNTVRLWSPDTGKFLRALEGHSQGVRSVAFSPDARFLVSASADRTIRLWSIAAVQRGNDDVCLAVLVPGKGNSWAAYTLDGRYKLGGEAHGLLGFTVGLCRFEPGELDAYPEAFDHPPRRIGDDEPLFALQR
jgi:WD40 repeat protein/nucleoside phosphorylase